MGESNCSKYSQKPIVPAVPWAPSMAGVACFSTRTVHLRGNVLYLLRGSGWIRCKGSAASKQTATDDEELYQRKTPIEHVLLRPGMYLGQMESSEISTFVLEGEEGEKKVVKKIMRYSPALLKIIDEILVNAADNRVRKGKMSYIRINASFSNGEMSLSVQNDGASIPIKVHSTEKIHIPEMIFGNLLTGSNFDDTTASVVGGRHGYGAKLTNIFSKKFEVTISSAKKIYTQQWESNMSVIRPPKIQPFVPEDSSVKAGFTRVSFTPDLARFQMSSDLNMENMMQLIERRAFDLAACIGPSIQVYYNDVLIPIQSFKDFVNLFSHSLKNDVTNSSFYHEGNSNWQIGVMRFENAEHMSFVNTLWTSRYTE